MRILLTGGGSGGHAIPILAVVKEIKRQFREPLSFLWLGSKSGFESRFAAEAHIPFRAVATGKMRRYFSLQNIADFFKIPVGIVQALFVVRKFRPDVTFSKGGFVSFPGVVASWFWRVPVLIHDSDLIPGLANKMAAPFAKKITISFTGAAKYFKGEKTILTGNPVRPEILTGNPEKARQVFKLKDDKPVLLVFCGSQGAARVNELLLDILPKLLDDFQVIHQTGQKNFLLIKKKTAFLAKQDYRPVPFIADEMPDVLALADIVVSRAGSNNINEILSLGKAAVLVPLSTAAQNHQWHNARLLEKKGAVVLVDETKATPHDLGQAVLDLWRDEERRNKLKARAKSLAKPDAAKDIAREVLALGEQKASTRSQKEKEE